MGQLFTPPATIRWVASHPLVRFWWHASIALLVFCGLASITAYGQYGHILPATLWLPPVLLCWALFGFRYVLCKTDWSSPTLSIRRQWYGVQLGPMTTISLTGEEPLWFAPGDVPGESLITTADGRSTSLYVAGTAGHRAAVVALALSGMNIGERRDD